MSFEHIAIAINHTQSTGAMRAVMIGIASHANDDGEAYPGMMKLAQYAGYEGWDALAEDDTSEAKAKARDARNRARRSAIKAVQKLEALGEIRVIQNGGGSKNRPEHMRPNLYQIELSCPPNCDHSAQHRLLTAEETEARLRKALGLLAEPVDNSQSDPVASRPPRGLQATTPVASRPPESSTNKHLGNSVPKGSDQSANDEEPEEQAKAEPSWAESNRRRVDPKTLQRQAAHYLASKRTDAQTAQALAWAAEDCPAAPGWHHWFPPSMTECARGCGLTLTTTEQENAA